MDDVHKNQADRLMWAGQSTEGQFMNTCMHFSYDFDRALPLGNHKAAAAAAVVGEGQLLLCHLPTRLLTFFLFYFIFFFSRN